jgi:predicted  nucleic acid-binding Zn-ribbon protein
MANNNKIDKKLELLRKEFKDEVRRAIGVAIEHFGKQTALVAEQYSTIIEKIERLEDKIEILEERIKALEEMIVDLKERVGKLEERLVALEKVSIEHSKILSQHMRILQEHTKILQEIRFELKTRVSYNEFIKLLNRVANLEKKVQELSKKK